MESTRGTYSSAFARGFRDGPYLSSERRLTQGESVKMTTSTPSQWEPTVTNLVALIALEIVALAVFRYFLGKVS